MSYRILQLSPRTRTQETQMRIAIQTPWQSSWRGSWNDPIDLSDITFLRSRIVYNSKSDDGTPTRRINWNLVLGMLLVVGISAGFWTGVGLMIAQVWK